MKFVDNTIELRADMNMIKGCYDYIFDLVTFSESRYEKEFGAFNIKVMIQVLDSKEAADETISYCETDYQHPEDEESDDGFYDGGDYDDDDDWYDPTDGDIDP